MKKPFKRLIFYLATILILLYLLLLIVTAFMTFAEYKLDMTTDMIFDSIIQTAIHPFHYTVMAIQEKNPLVMISGIAVIGYVLFLYFKSLAGEKSWKTDKNDTHGSAKWTAKKSLSKSSNYHLVNYSYLYNEWKKSIM